MALTEQRLKLLAGGREFNLAAWQRETGGEELLICVHGLGCSKQSYSGVFDRTELRDWSLLAFDLPGFGRSPRPADYSHDLKDQATLLRALLDANASRRIVLLAHSMGGTLSLLLPGPVLSRLAGMVLVEPRLLAASSTVSAEANRFAFDDFIQHFWPHLRARVARNPAEAFDLDHADPVAFYRSARSLGHWTRSADLVGAFLAAACPRCFVYGDRNTHLGELAALPASEQLRIPGAGHFPMQDNPEAFYRGLAGLLNARPR
jgi:pimeloyl-ACP methyl ester carboxylesterase